MSDPTFKHKVSTDALDTLGTIIGPNEKRDAIHLAVEPMIAKMDLLPGEHVTATGYATDGNDGVGIVDPFLKTKVCRGERFWLVIYPRMIHSLRHVWTHPAFSDEEEIVTLRVEGKMITGEFFTPSDSEKWLRKWISEADCPDFDTVISAALGESSEYDEDYGGDVYEIQYYPDWRSGDKKQKPFLFFRGRDAHSSIPDEFWDHVENFTGLKCPVRAIGFSCSC